MQLFLLIKGPILKSNRTKIALLLCFMSLNVVGMESLLFLKEFCLHPTEVGAVAATSSFTGDELCHYLSERDSNSGPLRILEVGGGFGNVSKIIAEHITDQDILDIVEINPEFCKKIEEKVVGKNNVSVQCCSIIDWKPEFQYDLIISTLPFNAFSYDFFKDIFAHIRTLGTSDVIFSYVEYLALGAIKDAFFFDKDVRDVKNFLKEEREKSVRIQKVWLNFPPLQVYHLKINENIEA